MFISFESLVFNWVLIFFGVNLLFISIVYWQFIGYAKLLNKYVFEFIPLSFNENLIFTKNKVLTIFALFEYGWRILPYESE